MAVEVSRRRFTADEYQAMGRAGILRREDLSLIHISEPTRPY